MYLAEDRILCWELVSKRGCSWILHYVKSAYVVTDVPDQVSELICLRASRVTFWIHPLTLPRLRILTAAQLPLRHLLQHTNLPKQTDDGLWYLLL